jgi:hypothetical protein
MTCAAARVAVAGPYSAVAEARGSDASGAEVADEDAVHFFGAVSGPAVDLEALVAGFDGDLPPGPRVAVPGDVVPFTYEVTNRGTVALRAIAVTDGVLGRVACPARTLAPGTTMVCRASVVARLGEFGATARVTARSGAVVVGDSDPVYYHVRPELRIHHLDLEVMVNQLAADDPTGPRLPVGGLARFAYVITYTGNNVVYNVTIQDPFVPEALITCDGDRILEAGETLRCAAAVPVVAGQYSSAVTAVSWDANGRRVSAEDRVHYFGVA